MQLGSMFISKR